MDALPSLRARHSEPGTLKMGSIRRSRTERSARAPGSRCTERDLHVLQAVGRMKVATTLQLTRLFFGTHRTASRRLAALHAARWLDVHVPLLHEPNHYTLTSQGLEVLRTAGRDPTTLHTGWRGLRREDLPHLRAINDLRIALVVGARGLRGVRLRSFRSDHDLRRTLSPGTRGRGLYIPDALVELEAEMGLVRLVVEIDRATQSAQAFAARKGHALAALDRELLACWSLPHPWVPIVFAPTERRLTNLAHALASNAPRPRWYGARLDVLVPDALYQTELRPLDVAAPAQDTASLRRLLELGAKPARPTR